MLLSLAALALVAVGLGGLVRLRTWGWLAVGASAVVTLVGGSLLASATVRSAFCLRRAGPGDLLPGGRRDSVRAAGAPVRAARA